MVLEVLTLAELYIEDIVVDLAESGIKITANDVEKKSITEARLCTYRISIPAQDFNKSLQPEIWPMRVKVCEYQEA